MAIKRYTLGDLVRDTNEGLSVFDRLWTPPTWTMLEGDIYNPKTHDLVPKREWLDEAIRIKEEKIEALKREMESYKKHYEERLKSLLLEKEQLVIQKNKK